MKLEFILTRAPAQPKKVRGGGGGGGGEDARALNKYAKVMSEIKTSTRL